jgi:hypothetical protein
LLFDVALLVFHQDDHGLHIQRRLPGDVVGFLGSGEPESYLSSIFETASGAPADLLDIEVSAINGQFPLLPSFSAFHDGPPWKK